MANSKTPVKPDDLVPNPVKIVFSAIGPDNRIHTLNRLLRRRLYNPKGKHAGLFCTELVVGISKDERTAIRATARWLKRYSKLLKSIDARKIIEFQACFEEYTGSKILCLEPDFMELLSRLDCALWHQSIQPMHRKRV